MRTRIGYLTAAAIAFSGLQAASAADLPTKAPAAINTAPYNWAGLYVGGNVGYGWGRASDPDVAISDPTHAGFDVFFAIGGNVLQNVQPKGVIGGGQIGYNWMVNPNWVVGFVTDIQASGVKASGSNSATVIVAGGALTTDQSNSAEIDWFGTARAKLGWAQNNWLLYATGGLAYGRVRTSGTIAFPTVTLSFAGSNDTTKVGWAAGAGLDYGITRNWTIGAEYLYVDLGDTSYTTEANAILPGTAFTVTNHNASHIARLSVNYKF